MKTGATRTAKSMAMVKPSCAKYTAVRSKHLAPGTSFVHIALNGVQRHRWMILKATLWAMRTVMRTLLSHLVRRLSALPKRREMPLNG